MQVAYHHTYFDFEKKIESIDMLRAIEYGYQIRMVETASEVVGVDTPEDLERVKILMKRDSLFSAYSKKT
mgnify:CR=1 FL=1